MSLARSDTLLAGRHLRSRDGAVKPAPKGKLVLTTLATINLFFILSMCAEAIPEGRECAQPLMGAHVRQTVRRTTRIVLLNDMIYHCPALKKYPGLFFYLCEVREWQCVCACAF